MLLRPCFANTHNKQFEKIMKPCAALTPYGVQPRYPDEIHLDEPLMRKALSYARQIKAFIKTTQEESNTCP